MIQYVIEMFFIAFGFNGDTWQIEAHHTEVVTSVMDLFAILFVCAQETAAAHGCFKGAGDFDDLVVIQNIRVHPFAGTFQRKLFDVVIRIVWL